MGVVVRNYGNRVNRMVSKLIRGSPSTRVMTNVSITSRKGGDCPMCAGVRRYRMRTSTLVSFSSTGTASTLLTCYRGHGLPIMLYAANLDRRRLTGIRRASGGITILGSTGVSLKVGALVGLLRSTTGILTATKFSVRVIRGRRELGLSTPDKATLTLTSDVGRTVSGRCRCVCSHDREHRVQSSGRVNVSTIHNKAVMKRRRIVFTNPSRIVRFGRATCSGTMFKGNTIRTTGFLTNGPTKECSVDSIVDTGWSKVRWGLVANGFRCLRDDRVGCVGKGYV